MKKNVLLALCSAISGLLMAQGTNQRFEQMAAVLPSAPNASAITKYGGINVNLSKGMINHAYPLYELAIKGATVPFSLNYTANGLRVDEYASRVGMNWSLEAGGVISRTVYGQPDESSQRLEMPAVGPVVDTAYYNFLVKATGGGSFDPQPDVFSYSFCGINGKFVLDKNKLPVTLDGSPIKIETNFSSSEWNFKITGLDGTQYFFGGSTATEETRTESTCSKPYNLYVPTSWYLKKIVNIHGREIAFNYSSIEFIFSTGYSVTQYFDGTPNLQCPDSTTGNPGGEPPPPILCVSYSSQNTTCEGILRSKGRYLTSVVASGIGRVDLQLAGQRLDCNDVLYSGMTVKDSAGRSVRKYQFEYENKGGQRPYLIAVKRVTPGLPLQEITQFVYNPGVLPQMHSFSQDHYGYYNGAANSTLLPLPPSFTLEDRFPAATANREPNPAFAAMGILSKVVYPTGGSDTIMYEGNDFNEYKLVVPAKDTLHIVATGTAFKQTTTVVSAPFTITYEQETRLEISIENLNSSSFDPIHDRGTAVVKTQSGTEIFSYNDNPGYYGKKIVVLAAGTYVLEARGTGLGISANVKMICRPGNAYMDSVNTLTAGVRVKKVITTTHGADAKPQVKTFNYNNPASPLRSSGGAQSPPEYLNYFQNRQFCNRGVVAYLYCNYSGMYSSPRVPVLMYEGGVSYAAVKENLGGNAENGAVQHYYHLETLSFASQAGMGNGSFIGAPFTNTGTLNSREKQTLVYRKDGSNLTLVKKTDYSYKIDSRGFKIIEGTAVNKKFENNIVNSFLTTVDFEGFDVARYSNIVNWVYLDTLRETQFEAGVLPIVVSTVYQYDNVTHKQLSKSVGNLSDGRLVETVQRYPQDFSGITGTDAISASIKNLQTRSVIAVPVETMSYVSDANGSNKSLTGARLAVFDNGAVDLKEVWQTEHSAPLTNFTPLLIVSGSAVKDSRYKKQLTIASYDNSGNVLQQQMTNNVVKSYIWGYNQSMPIAEVSNADSGEIFFDSFEDQDGWDNAGLTYDGSRVHSGRVSARVNAPSSAEMVNHSHKWLNVSLASPRKFRYSGWVYSDGPSVDLYLIMKTASEPGYYTYIDAVTTNVTGKWVYLEKEYTVPQNITRLVVRVDNNGNGNIWFDDIRVHPSDAQMNSYTYDPLIGMTSQSDLNNRFTYYEYDSFGRMSIVRDHDKNIVKKICYNYQGQVDNCSFNVYFSVDTSRTFVRNNCGTNGTGASMVYNVPGGKYTSMVSQADANQQAFNELDNAQAAVNATAGCTWVNQPQYGSFTRQCPEGYVGSVVNDTIPNGVYSSSVSLADANLQAQNALAVSGQNKANAQGTCTIVCTTSNCTGTGKKCVNNTCQTGVKVYTFCEHVTGSVYRHYYHYEWSDGSWSQDFTELNSNVCDVE